MAAGRKKAGVASGAATTEKRRDDPRCCCRHRWEATRVGRIRVVASQARRVAVKRILGSSDFGIQMERDRLSHRRRTLDDAGVRCVRCAVCNGVVCRNPMYTRVK